MTITPHIEDVRTLIIGAGFSGLAIAIRLRAEGDDEFLILDRGADVGGTWRDNTYPGVACDIPSHLYSLSSHPNPEWSRVFAPGGEIYQYLRGVAQDEGLYDFLRLNTMLERADWDEDAERWIVHTSTGVIRCQFLVPAMGHLADARFPEIPGLDSFPGIRLHTAEWDNAVDLAGLRIGVVGTGASAIQVVPELAQIAEQLVVFQRTPAWIMPRPDHEYTALERRLFAIDPAAIGEVRSDLFWRFEEGYAARRGLEPYLSATVATVEGHLERSIADPKLRELLRPDYKPGCKRILISDTFYPALTRPNVTLEASAADRIEGSTLIAASGERYELDALVFATGFETTRPQMAHLFFGSDGSTLADHWEHGLQGFASTTVHGFPNLLIMNGPNTGLGHNSVIYIFEAQAEYVAGAIHHAVNTGATRLEVRRESEESYAAKLDGYTEGTVWLAGGCNSWYIDQSSGRLTLMWPDFAHMFRANNSVFDPNDYEIGTAVAAS